MNIKSFHDKDTGTFTHVISDPQTQRCAVIDPVLDYDMIAGKTSTKSADQIIEYIKSNSLKLDWILESHIHADHLSSAQYLKNNLGGKVAIGRNILKVLEFWTEIFNTKKDTPLDGSQFDHLFTDGENFKIGNLQAQVIFTPGHTPSCSSYLIGDALFVGDALLMPHFGTARTDFPGGNAKELYHSIQKIYALPDSTRIFTCHDYPENGATALSESTVGEHKKHNVLLNEKTAEAQYVEARNKRDFGKAVPKLLLPSIQLNIRAGALGDSEENGIQYIKIPLNKF